MDFFPFFQKFGDATSLEQILNNQMSLILFVVLYILIKTINKKLKKKKKY